MRVPLLLLFILFSLFGQDPLGATERVKVTLDCGKPVGEISPYLTGVCLNAAEDTDERWADGRIIETLKMMRTKVLRWPDTAASYHWKEAPGASVWKDAWETDPEDYHYVEDRSTLTHTNGMEIDDLLEVCRKTGATPMIGLNFQSGLRCDRLDDSLQESLELMRYCKEQDFKVTYWRLGNEPYEYSTEQLADVINMFVPEMKKIDPDIKIVFGIGNRFCNDWVINRWTELLKLAGDNLDVLDMHQYWRWALYNADKKYLPSWQAFMDENPLYHDIDAPATFAEQTIALRNSAREITRRDIEVINSEWNCGPVYGADFGAYQFAMVRAAIMMQFIESELFMALMWAGTFDDRGSESGFIDPQTLEPRPAAHVIRLYSVMGGGQRLETHSDDMRVRTVGAMSSDQKTAWLFMLNKNPEARTVRVRLSGCMSAACDVETLAPTTDNLPNAEMKIIKQHSAVVGRELEVSVPGSSFSRITFMLE